MCALRVRWVSPIDPAPSFPGFFNETQSDNGELSIRLVRCAQIPCCWLMTTNTFADNLTMR